jgi:hypothetical protein
MSAGMIPKRKPDTAPAILPDDLPILDGPPPIPHRAIDYEFTTSAGICAFSLIDDQGTLLEEGDRYVAELRMANGSKSTNAL